MHGQYCHGRWGMCSMSSSWSCRFSLLAINGGVARDVVSNITCLLCALEYPIGRETNYIQFVWPKPSYKIFDCQAI